MIKFKFLKKKLIFVFLLFNTTLVAQYSSYNLELSSNYVESFLLDRRGGKWIGTDEGLNLITPSNNTVFYSNISNKKGLLNSEVYELKELNNGLIAAFSNEGLSFFNPKTFSFKRVELESRPVAVNFDSQSNTYWVSSEFSGVYVLNSSLEIQFHLKYDPLNPTTLSSSSFDYANKNNLIVFGEEKIFIGTPNGFNVFNRSQKTVKRYIKQRSSSLLSNNIKSIVRISNNELLVATGNGINIFNEFSEKFDKNIFGKGVDVDLISKIDENTDVIVSGGDLYTYNISNTDITFHYNVSKEPNLNSLRKGDHLYLYSKGGNELNKINLKSLSKESFLIPSGIQTVYITEGNKVFIGTDQGIYTESNVSKLVSDIDTRDGVLFYNVSENRSISVYKELILISYTNKQKQRVYRVNVDINSNTKFELKDDLLFVANENLSIIDLSSSRSLENIFSANDILNGKLNNVKLIDSVIYLSTGNGVVSYLVPDKFDLNFKNDFLSSQIKYKYNKLINPNIPKSFSDIELVNSFLWVSDFNTGLRVYKENFNNYVKNYSYEEGNRKTLASGSVTKLFFNSKSQNLLIASRGDGMFSLSLKDSLFTNFTVGDGLLSNNIYDFMKKDELVWVQTGNGVNSINNKSDIRNINSIDGLDINSFHREALHSVGEKIIVSGVDNIQEFNPNKIDDFQKEKFDLHVLNVIGYDKENQKQVLPISDDNLIEIDNSISSIELTLFTNSSFKPNQIKYYLSSDIYQDVLSNGYNNMISLKSIPLYSSEFKISAINSSGDESENIISLKINNLPPWWLRIESIVGYVILLIITVTFFVKYREKMTKEKMEGERKSKELEEAKELQNSLLPKVLPTVDGFEISTYLKPATEIGGDYYDFFYKKGEYFYAICGDATGHGVISGIMVSVTKAGLNGVPMGEPSTILGQLNRIVKRVNFGRLRMSLSVAKFNKNAVELSSAAMPPTYFFSSKSKEVEEVLVPNLPLGGLENEKFDGIKKDFKPGDVMVMISDGLPELPNPSDDLLDYDKIEACIKNNAEKSASEIKDALVFLSDDWANGVMNPDDITIVIIKKAA